MRHPTNRYDVLLSILSSPSSPATLNDVLEELRAEREAAVPSAVAAGEMERMHAASLQEQIEDVTAECEMLRSLLVQTNARGLELIKERDAARAECEKLRAVNSDLLSERNALRIKLAETNAAGLDLITDRDAAQAECEELRRNLAEPWQLDPEDGDLVDAITHCVTFGAYTERERGKLIIVAVNAHLRSRAEKEA